MAESKEDPGRRSNHSSDRYDSDNESDDEFPENHISRLRDANPNCSDSNRSIRRYDEYASFLTRSQRARERPDVPPATYRRVTFPENHRLVRIHEIEPWAEEDKPRLFLDSDDFAVTDHEIELLGFRWENHLAGKIPLDPEQSTIRGLESTFIVDEDDACNTRGRDMRQHRTHVLRHLIEQHNNNNTNSTNSTNSDNPQSQQHFWIDWEALRRASLLTSTPLAELAHRRGQQDAVDAQQAWLPPDQRTPDPWFGKRAAAAGSGNDSKKKKKKKKGLMGFLFR